MNISAKGTTADWTLVVHDPQNREIATSTVVNASLSASGNYEFVFSSVWRPVVGATYHFHITATNTTGTPTIVSGTANNLETGQFVSYYQFLVTDIDYHPIEQITNLLAIGNERYLATYDAATYNPHKLIFPSGWRVRCLALWREYIAIGCWKGDAIEDYDQGIIFFWDGVNDTYNFYLNVPEGAVNAMIGSQGTLFIVAGYSGDLLEYTGGDKAKKVKRLPNLEVGKQIEVLPGALTMWKTMFRIGVGKTDSSIFEQGVYTWGSLNMNYSDSLSFDYRISTNNTQSSGIRIGLLLPVEKKLLIGWEDNLSFGLDSVNPAATIYADGSIEFLIKDEGGIYKEKKIDLIRTDFTPIVSGDTIGLQYKIDRQSAWSIEETNTTVDSKKLRVQTPKTRHQEYQVKLNVSTTNTTSPAIYGVSVIEDILEGEKYV